MIETLQSTTSLVGTGLITSPTSTSASGVKKVKNPETKEEEWDINAFRVGTGLAVSTTSTAAPTIQELEYQRVINDVRSEMAIVECASDVEKSAVLAELDQMIELSSMFEEEATDTLGEYADAKKPYTR